MKVRVICEGDEIGEDGLIIAPWPSKKAPTEVLLWLSVAVGYNAPSSPKGSFRVGTNSVEPVAFPTWNARLEGWVTPLELAFDGEDADHKGAPQTASVPDSSSAPTPAPASKALPPVSRELLLVAPWVLCLLIPCIFVAAIGGALLIWTWGEALALEWGGNDQVSSDLWQRAAQIMGFVPLIGLLGISTAFARRTAVRNWRWCVFGIPGIMLLALVGSKLGLVVIENGTEQPVPKIGTHRTALEPGEHLTVFSSRTAVDEPFQLEDAAGPSNLSGWVKALIAGKRQRAVCKKWATSQDFAAEWKKQKECTPDPTTTAKRDYWQLFEPGRKEPRPAVAEYTLQPFLSSFKDRPLDFSSAPRLDLIWPTDSPTPYTALVVEGDQAIREVEVALPPPEGLSPRSEPRLPWRADERRAPHIVATVRSGRIDVGSLICAQPVPVSDRPSSAVQRVQLQFLHTGAHVRRVLLRTSEGAFVSEFEAARPEMITDVPICVPAPADPNQPRDLQLEVHVAEGFATEVWQLRLDGNGPKGRCNAGKDGDCSIAARVASVRMFLADDRNWGTLDIRQKTDCQIVRGVRAELAPEAIKKATPESGAVSDSDWTRALTSAEPDDRPKEFLACFSSSASRDATFRVTLADDEFRKVATSNEATTVRRLDAQRCYLDANAHPVPKRKGCRDGSDKFGPKKPLNDFLPPGCRTDSWWCE